MARLGGPAAMPAGVSWKGTAKAIPTWVGILITSRTGASYVKGHDFSRADRGEILITPRMGGKTLGDLLRTSTYQKPYPSPSNTGLDGPPSRT